MVGTPAQFTGHIKFNAFTCGVGLVHPHLQHTVVRFARLGNVTFCRE